MFDFKQLLVDSGTIVHCKEKHKKKCDTMKREVCGTEQQEECYEKFSEQGATEFFYVNARAPHGKFVMRSHSKNAHLNSTKSAALKTMKNVTMCPPTQP